MDELGFNKIAGAVLATALGVMVLRELPHLLIHSNSPETPVYIVGSLEPTGGEEDAAPLPFPQASWVDAMDAARGAKVFKKCTSCHNADKGGAHTTGPNLYAVIGAASAARSDFKYSSAMASAGITWDYETLNDYLAKPTRYVSGTNMNFVGLKKAEDRAAVIEYLRIAADSPVPKPSPALMPTLDETDNAILAEDGTPPAELVPEGDNQ